MALIRSDLEVDSGIHHQPLGNQDHLTGFKNLRNETSRRSLALRFVNPFAIALLRTRFSNSMHFSFNSISISPFTSNCQKWPRQDSNLHFPDYAAQFRSYQPSSSPSTPRGQKLSVPHLPQMGRPGFAGRRVSSRRPEVVLFSCPPTMTTVYTLYTDTSTSRVNSQPRRRNVPDLEIRRERGEVNRAD